MYLRGSLCWEMWRSKPMICSSSCRAHKRARKRSALPFLAEDVYYLIEASSLGGCSKPPCEELSNAERSTCLLRLCIAVLSSTLRCSCSVRPGTPSMCQGVCSAFGPGCLSLRRENSLQGGAAHMAPTRPECAMRMSSSKTASSRMLSLGFLSRSNGSKVSLPSEAKVVQRGA